MEDNKMKKQPIYKVGDVIVANEDGAKILITAVKDGNAPDIFYVHDGTELQYSAILFDEDQKAHFCWYGERFLIENAKRIGHIDISLLTGVSDTTDEKKKWEVTQEDWPEIKKSLEDTGMEVETKVAKDIRSIGDAIMEPIKKLKEENDSLKMENKELQKAYDDQAAFHEAWKQGWYECLKSFGYYLNS